MTHVGSLTDLPARFGLAGDAGAWILAAAFALGGFLVGVVAELALTRGMGALASRSSTRLDDVLAGAFRGPIRLFFTLVGALLAVLVLPAPALAHAVASRLLDVAVLLVLVVLTARVLGGLIVAYGERSRLVGSTRRFLRRVAVTAIYVVGVLFILDNQGISITPLLTTLGLAGLAAALAFQDTLANFFAGVYVQADRPLDVGHRVRFEDLKVEGTVVDVGWRTTKLRTAEGDLLVIPNTKVAAGVVIDYDLPEPRTMLRIPVRVSKDADPRRVAQILEETARELAEEGIVGEPKARFHPGFVGGAFELTLHVETRDYEARDRVGDELRHRIVERLRGEGVAMA
jgi:small-conductance mechanosensitive channel